MSKGAEKDMEFELFTVRFSKGQKIEVEINQDVLNAYGKTLDDINEKYSTVDLYNSIFKLLNVLQDKA